MGPFRGVFAEKADSVKAASEKPVAAKPDSEKSALGKALDGSNAHYMAEAVGCNHRGVAHTSEQFRERHLGAFVLVLDGCFGDGPSQQMTSDHHEAHFRRPGECGRSSGSQEGCDHEDRGSNA